MASDRIAEILTPFVTSKRWLSYGERAASPVQRLMILAHAALIRELYKGLDKNLCITKNKADAAFAIIGQNKKVTFALTDDQVKTWARAMSRRLRTMLRHFSQALVKTNQWAISLINQRDETEAEQPPLVTAGEGALHEALSSDDHEAEDKESEAIDEAAAQDEEPRLDIQAPTKKT